VALQAVPSELVWLLICQVYGNSQISYVGWHPVLSFYVATSPVGQVMSGRAKPITVQTRPPPSQLNPNLVGISRCCLVGSYGEPAYLAKLKFLEMCNVFAPPPYYKHSALQYIEVTNVTIDLVMILTLVMSWRIRKCNPVLDIQKTLNVKVEIFLDQDIVTQVVL
jgi:hypothetical protein